MGISIEEKVNTIISSINDIKRQQSLLSIEENKMSQPMVSDLTLIGNIYDAFTAFESDEGEMPLRQKKFLFVIMYLYCPAALAGSRMRRGVRDKVARIIGCTSSNISHDYKNVAFYYKTYRGFRADCNKVTEYIINHLNL